MERSRTYAKFTFRTRGERQWPVTPRRGPFAIVLLFVCHRIRPPQTDDVGGPGGKYRWPMGYS